MFIERRSKVEEKINYIHELIKEIYSDAISVRIFVNNQGIEVNPQYRTNVNGYSMQTINGKWIKSNI